MTPGPDISQLRTRSAGRFAGIDCSDRASGQHAAAVACRHLQVGYPAEIRGDALRRVIRELCGARDQDGILNPGGIRKIRRQKSQETQEVCRNGLFSRFIRLLAAIPVFCSYLRDFSLLSLTADRRAGSVVC